MARTVLRLLGCLLVALLWGGTVQAQTYNGYVIQTNTHWSNSPDGSCETWRAFRQANNQSPWDLAYVTFTIDGASCWISNSARNLHTNQQLHRRNVNGTLGPRLQLSEYTATYATSTTQNVTQVQCSTGACAVDLNLNHAHTHTHNIQWPDALTGLTPEKTADYMELWGLFLLAAVVVLGGKAIYNRFRVDYDH